MDPNRGVGSGQKEKSDETPGPSGFDYAAYDARTNKKTPKKSVPDLRTDLEKRVCTPHPSKSRSVQHSSQSVVTLTCPENNTNPNKLISDLPTGLGKRGSTPYQSNKNDVQNSTQSLSSFRCPENNRLIDYIVGDGITPGDVSKLKSQGFLTVESVAFSPIKKIVSVKGISDLKAKKIMETCLAATAGMGFAPASSVLQIRNEMIKITTGSKALDKLLGGGIETGSITELYGKAGSGKTFICHQLAVNAQLPIDMGGGEGKSIFIDTTSGFRTERIIACGQKHDLPDCMENAFFSRAYSTDMMMKLLFDAAAILTTERGVLLIVDSFTKLFRVEYCARAELAERQQSMAKVLRFLKGIAEELGIAVVVTTEVVANVDGGVFQPAYKAVGGHILAHQVVTRLHVKKMGPENRMIQLEKSPHLPASDCVVRFVSEGVEDTLEDF